MKPDHEHHHHDHHHVGVRESSSVSISKPATSASRPERPLDSSLLMAGSAKRIMYACCLIALLWLAVAWAVSSVD